MARKRPGTFYTFSIFLEHLPRPTRSREEHIRCMEIAEFRWHGSGGTGEGRTSPHFMGPQIVIEMNYTLSGLEIGLVELN